MNLANTARLHRVADEIQKTLMGVLLKHLRDPRLQWISITSVEMTRDLSAARVYYSTLSDQTDVEAVQKALNKAKGLFRKHISKEIHLRGTPDLFFCYDDSIEYGYKMDSAIAKARTDDQSSIQHNDEDQDDGENKKKLSHKWERLR